MMPFIRHSFDAFGSRRSVGAPKWLRAGSYLFRVAGPWRVTLQHCRGGIDLIELRLAALDLRCDQLASSSSFAYALSPARFCVCCSTNTMRNVMMVVAVFTTSCHAAMARPPGFEPGTIRLKVGCSTTELRAPGGPLGDPGGTARNIGIVPRLSIAIAGLLAPISSSAATDRRRMAEPDRECPAGRAACTGRALTPCR